MLIRSARLAPLALGLVAASGLLVGCGGTSVSEGKLPPEKTVSADEAKRRMEDMVSVKKGNMLPPPGMGPGGMPKRK